jgi:hypothetical protein
VVLVRALELKAENQLLALMKIFLHLPVRLDILKLIEFVDHCDKFLLDVFLKIDGILSHLEWDNGTLW